MIARANSHPEGSDESAGFKGPRLALAGRRRVEQRALLREGQHGVQRDDEQLRRPWPAEQRRPDRADLRQARQEDQHRPGHACRGEGGLGWVNKYQSNSERHQSSKRHEIISTPNSVTHVTHTVLCPSAQKIQIDYIEHCAVHSPPVL